MAASSEVDLAHGRVRNESVGNFWRVRSLVVDDVQASSGETSFPIDISKGPEASWRKFGAFEDGCVSGCQGECDGARSEDIRRIPRTCQFDQTGDFG